MKKFEGIRNTINNQNYEFFMNKGFSDSINVIMFHVGVIEEGRVSFKPLCKDLISSVLLKEKAMEYIDRIMDVRIRPEDIFKNKFNHNMFSKIDDSRTKNYWYNSDNFYYNPSVKYTRKPNEFIIMTIGKMIHKKPVILNDMDLEDEAYKAIMDFQDYTKSNYMTNEDKFYKDIEDLHYIGLVLENDKMAFLKQEIGESTHQNCIDIIPQEWMLLKPIQPLLVFNNKIDCGIENWKEESVQQLFKSEIVFPCFGPTYQNWENINNYQFVYHYSSLMDYVTRPAQRDDIHKLNPDDHEMNWFTSDMDGIQNFLLKNIPKQKFAIEKEFKKFQIYTWRDAIFDVKVYSDSKYVSSIRDFVNDYYVEGFRQTNCQIDIEIPKINKNERDLEL